jgi:hypothetical protein
VCVCVCVCVCVRVRVCVRECETAHILRSPFFFSFLNFLYLFLVHLL